MEDKIKEVNQKAVEDAVANVNVDNDEELTEEQVESIKKRLTEDNRYTEEPKEKGLIK